MESRRGTSRSTRGREKRRRRQRTEEISSSSSSEEDETRPSSPYIRPRRKKKGEPDSEPAGITVRIIIPDDESESEVDEMPSLDDLRIEYEELKHEIMEVESETHPTFQQRCQPLLKIHDITLKRIQREEERMKKELKQAMDIELKRLRSDLEEEIREERIAARTLTRSKRMRKPTRDKDDLSISAQQQPPPPPPVVDNNKNIFKRSIRKKLTRDQILSDVSNMKKAALTLELHGAPPTDIQSHTRSKSRIIKANKRSLSPPIKRNVGRPPRKRTRTPTHEEDDGSESES